MIILNGKEKEVEVFWLSSSNKYAQSLYYIAVGYHVIALTLIGTVMMFFI